MANGQISVNMDQQGIVALQAGVPTQEKHISFHASKEFTEISGNDKDALG